MKTQPAKAAKKANSGAKIFLGLLIFFILILAILPFFINPIADRLVKQQIKALFGEKLKIGSVNVSFLTGATVRINQIELRQPTGCRQGSLLKADSIRIRVALVPLLKQQLIIHQLTIVRPKIYLVQTKNGQTNLGVYLAQFTGKPAAGSSGPSFTVRLRQFKVKNGRIILASYNLSDRQPTFELTNCNLSLNNLQLPNPDRIATKFRFNGLLGVAHPAPVRVTGIGIFGARAISFTAKSRITNLPVADYGHLISDMPFTITAGKAWVTSDARCNNNYLNSYQHVILKDLKLKARKGHALSGALLGVPANILTKAIEDENSSFSFDFTVSGPFQQIKVNLKFKVFQAIGKSIRAKLGLTKITSKAASGFKKAGSKIGAAFKGLFKKKND